MRWGCTKFCICSTWFPMHLFSHIPGSMVWVLELLYTAPWLSFYFLQKVSGQQIPEGPQRIGKIFIVASILVVHIHTKGKNSKTQISWIPKVCHLFYFVIYFFLFFSRDSFILKSFFKKCFIVHQIFVLSKTHTRLKIKLGKHNKGAFDSRLTMHLGKWCVPPLHVSNLLICFLGPDLPPVWIEHDLPVNLKTFMQELVHRRYTSNVHESTSSNGSLIEFDTMSNLIKTNYFNISTMFNSKGLWMHINNTPKPGHTKNGHKKHNIYDTNE